MRIGIKRCLADSDPAIDLEKRLKLASLKIAERFRVRLRANPCLTRSGKRLGLLWEEEQEVWVDRKGQRHGFFLPQVASFNLSESPRERVDVRLCQEQMLRRKRNDGVEIRIYLVLYDGVLSVSDTDSFRTTLLGGVTKHANREKAITMGIGHGRAMGLGLLSVVPIT